jgi:16S rRNA (guanine966-N2)-methyltransferase
VVENLKSNKYLNDPGLIIIERSIQTKERDITNLGTEPLKIIGDTCLYEI